MKTIRSIILGVILTYTLATTAYAADIFAVRTALNKQPEHKDCAISVTAGSVLEFSAADLERRMGLGANTLQGITVTNLPSDAQGAFVLDGVEVNPYEFINREALDRLCFVPNETAVSASATFVPQGKGAVTTNLAISVMDVPNVSPNIENTSFNTMKNVSITGFIPCTDPDGDAFKLQCANAPRKGEVTFSGQNFTYVPYKNMSGVDSFTVCAVDEHNNYSREALVEIKIEEPRISFQYADMTTNPSAYAAIKLREKNVMSGKQVGNSWFFYPDHMVSRGEMLVMVMAASGLEDGMQPTVNTGLPNDADLPQWLKPYVKKAVDEKVFPADQPFAYKDVPMRAEAVVMVDRAAKINDVKSFSLQMHDQIMLPDWARSSYTDLSAYKMLDLHDGNAYPFEMLTNSYAADLVWQLWKHCNK